MKAALSMWVMLSGTVQVPVQPPGHWISLVWFLSKRTPSRLLKAVLRESAQMAVKPMQPDKALYPMVVTL